MVQRVSPEQIDHIELRELARRAVWVSQLDDAVGLLEDRVADMEELHTDEHPQAQDNSEEPALDENDRPFATALEVVDAAWEAADTELEFRVIEWLARDPEHWPIFRLVLLDPWFTPSGWRPGTPGWVHALGSNTVLAHFNYDPYGRGKGGRADVESIREMLALEDAHAASDKERPKPPRIRDPRKVKHPLLRELAECAAVIAQLERSRAELNFLNAVPERKPGRKKLPRSVRRETQINRELWEMEPLFAVQVVVDERRHREQVELEAQTSAWLAQDPEHWEVFRRLVFDPWLRDDGKPSRQTPRWVLILGSLKALTPYHQKRYRLRSIRGDGHRIKSFGAYWG